MIPATSVACCEPGPQGVAVVSPGYGYTFATITLLLAYVASGRPVRTPPDTRCAFGKPAGAVNPDALKNGWSAFTPESISARRKPAPAPSGLDGIACQSVCSPSSERLSSSSGSSLYVSVTEATCGSPWM